MWRLVLGLLAASGCLTLLISGFLVWLVLGQVDWFHLPRRFVSSVRRRLLPLFIFVLGIFVVGFRLLAGGAPGGASVPPGPAPTGRHVVTWRIEPAPLPTLPLPRLPTVAPTVEPPPFKPVAPRPTPETPLVGAPVHGPVTQAFGCSPFYTGMPGPGCPADTPWFHDGLDLLAETGTPVRAAITGTVIFAGPDGDGPQCEGYRGYGLGVVVDNGLGWQTLYAHLSQIDVAPGQAVTPQTVIGAVGDTGCASGAHLHFGLRREGQLVDPQAYLAAKQIP